MGFEINGIKVTGRFAGYSVSTEFPPVVTAVSPSSGSFQGGNTVTITGNYFTGTTSVTIGGQSATNVSVVSDTTITARVPSVDYTEVGAVSVNVTTPIGTNANNSFYTYIVPAPIANLATPSSGTLEGGTTVTLAGNEGLKFVTSVTFNGVDVGTVSVVGSNISVVSPGGSVGPVAIVMTSPYGTGQSGALFSYVYPAPTIASVSPNSGYTFGGTEVTITGTGFYNVTGVRFDGVNATSFTVNSSTSITAVTPANSSGSSDITVIAGGGNRTVGGLFTYVSPPAPVVSSITPSRGTVDGGTSVTISGSNFLSVEYVRFSGVNATSYTVIDSETITAVTPARPSGAQAVTVRSAGVNSNSNVTFTFADEPAITSITPSSSDILGGQTVTIAGSEFTGATSVMFGTESAAFTVVNNTTITATTPDVATSGNYSVTVTTDIGTSAPYAFTYVESALSLTAPIVTDITVGETSGNFTVLLANARSGQSVLVTPVSTPSGCTFTPESVTLTQAQPSATFTLTSSQADSYDIGITNDSSILNPAAVPFTVLPPADPTYYVVAAMDNSPYIQAYEWDTESGFGIRYSSPAVLPTRSISGTIAVSPDGRAVAVAASVATGPQVYSFSKTGFGNLYSPPAVSPASNQSGVDFSPSGNVLAFTGSSGDRVFAYQWSTSSGFGTRYSSPSVALNASGNDIKFNPAGNKIAIGTSTSPYIHMYEWSDATGFGTKFSNPATVPPGNVQRLAWSPDGNYLAAIRYSNTSQVYSVNENSWGSRYAIASNPHQDVAFSLDGNTLFFPYANTTAITAYPWTGTALGTMYAPPSSVPAASYSVAVSPYDGTVLVGSSATSGPALSAYKWNGNAWGTRYSNPATPGEGIVRTVRFGRIQ